MDATMLLTFLVGLALGGVLAVLWMRSRAADQRVLADRLEARFGARLGAAEGVVAPVRESLERFESRLREIETSRVELHAALREQIDAVRLSGEALRRETGALATALRRPTVRGRWGELHLARVTEIAGLVDHCDVTFQHTGTNTSGDLDAVQRPDLVVHLAGGKHLVVDAKVPLDGFLDAAEAPTDELRTRSLRIHARQVRAHVDALADKAYWRLLPATPEFVVLFMPGEAFLSHALEVDAQLLEYAADRHVVLATPTTLIALLRTVAYAWNEQSLTANAREVFELGRELYGRLGRLGRHFERLGRALGGAVGAYNEAVGSLETRVLVSARRLRDLGLTGDELAAPSPVEAAVRPLGAPEMVSREYAASEPEEPDGAGKPSVDRPTRFGRTPEEGERAAESGRARSNGVSRGH